MNKEAFDFGDVVGYNINYEIENALNGINIKYKNVRLKHIYEKNKNSMHHVELANMILVKSEKRQSLQELPFIKELILFRISWYLKSGYYKEFSINVDKYKISRETLDAQSFQNDLIEGLCHIFCYDQYFIDDALVIFAIYFPNLDLLLKGNMDIKKAKIVGLKNQIMDISMTRWMLNLSTKESLRQYSEYVNKFIDMHGLEKEDSLEYISDIIKYCLGHKYIKGLLMLHKFVNIPTQFRENSELKKMAEDVLYDLLQNGFIGDAKVIIDIFNIEKTKAEKYFQAGLLNILKYKNTEENKLMKYFFHDRLVNIIGWYVDSGYLSEKFIKSELVKKLGLDFYHFLIEINEQDMASKLKKDLNL